MSYYPTLAEDVARAKEILAKGRGVRGWLAGIHGGGTIYGADTYAAYKLLESFVAEIEQLRLGLDTAAQSAVALQRALVQSQAQVARQRVTAVTARCSSCGACCDDIQFEYEEGGLDKP